MDTHINFFFVPSLKHMALTKTVFMLWCQKNISVLLAKEFHCGNRCYFYTGFYGNEDTISDTTLSVVMDEAKKFHVPEHLKQDILHHVKPVGLFISAWIDKHQKKYFPDIYLPSEFCLTPHGTINEKETARVLVEDSSLNIITRYKLACTYCLESNILELWGEIPVNLRNFCEREDRYVYKQPLVAIWTYEMGGPVTYAELSEMFNKILLQSCSLYFFAFKFSARQCNKAATEFYLQKLIRRERDDLIVDVAVYYPDNSFPEHFTDIFCMLFSQMDSNEQLKVLEFPQDLLHLFIAWPWQDVFLEMVYKVWDYLPDSEFSLLLQDVAGSIEAEHDTAIQFGGKKNCTYSRYFSQLWHMSSDHYKTYVLNMNTWTFAHLFSANDIENIQLLFDYATIIQRKKIVFSDQGSGICENLVYNEKWDLLEFFLTDCIANMDQAFALYESVLRFLEDKYCNNFAEYHKVIVYFRNFLDKFMFKEAKRTMIQNDDVAIKRRRLGEESD